MRIFKNATLLLICGVICNFSYADQVNEFYQSGKTYLDAGRYHKALDKFNKAIASTDTQTSPELISGIHYNIGLVHFHLEEFENAVSEYNKAIDIKSDSPVYYNALGIVYSELKQYKKALDIYRKIIKYSPKTAEPFFNIGLVHYNQGDFSSAIDAFKQAISVNNKWTDAYIGLGDIYLKQGQLSQSEQEYKNALQVKSDSIGALMGLGKVYLRQGDTDKARPVLEQVIKIQKDYTEAHFQIAQLYIKNGEKDNAESTMAYFRILRDTDPLLVKAQKWVKIHPDDSKGYNNLGILFLTRRCFEKAIQNYKKAIVLSPTLASAHYNLGHAYHKQGKRKLAIDAYQLAIENDSELAIAHNNLAVCYSELNTHLNKALSHALIATKKIPTNPNYWDTLATIYTQLGSIQEAQQARAKQTSLLMQSQK